MQGTRRNTHSLMYWEGCVTVSSEHRTPGRSVGIRSRSKIPGPEFWGFGPAHSVASARPFPIPLPPSTDLSFPIPVWGEASSKAPLDSWLREILPPAGPRPPGTLCRLTARAELGPPQPGICTQEPGAEDTHLDYHCGLGTRGALPPAGRGAGTRRSGGSAIVLTGCRLTPCGRTSVDRRRAHLGQEIRDSAGLGSGETRLRRRASGSVQGTTRRWTGRGRGRVGLRGGKKPARPAYPPLLLPPARTPRPPAAVSAPRGSRACGGQSPGLYPLLATWNAAYDAVARSPGPGTPDGGAGLRNTRSGLGEKLNCFQKQITGRANQRDVAALTFRV